MRTFRLALTGFTLLGLATAGVRAADVDKAPAAPAPDVQPAAEKPQPVDPAVVALIDQLGSGEPAIREAASKKLLELGKSAVPTLKQSKDADDPEVRARVRSLIRKAERRLPPAAPAKDGNAHRQSVSVSMVNGQRNVDVDDNGYKIKIRQGPEGIVLDVTGVEDDKPVTETYRAKDADELKKENPEAFALYEKYNNGGPGGAFTIQLGGNAGFQGQVFINGGNPRGFAGGVQVEQKVAEAQVKAMEKVLEKLQEDPNIPAEHRAKIIEQIEQLRAKQQDVQQKQLKEMEQRREKALDELKVPLRDEPAKDGPAKDAKKD
ncbi:OmpH family outer membrane protein [Humisphaera borealis]|uniref:OmpH family outer membrane protein n=1 Tax=Humisphaera borealis TaxID=2807512 RepID=A0A7M2WYJ8_9BACT|nr:OmpH family outer membrane protein [Humisphaera borealis]QOV90483.1 OmpH family outer membrane protein [Humisphaera borealis]